MWGAANKGSTMDQGLIEPAQRLAVHVTGMSCAGCVRRVERTLAAVPGVTAVAVNLATERATLTTAGPFESATLDKALAQAGYPAETETIDLAIIGMTCASCAGRVEHGALTVPGVLSAAVNLATDRLRVRRFTGDAAAGDLIAAVRRAGYEAALPITDQPNAPPPRRLWTDGTAAAAALVLAAPLVAPMLAMPFGVHIMLPGLVQLALAAIVQVAFGARFYRGAWKAARSGLGTMDTLVALGTSAAFGLSVWALIAGHGAPLYFEASAAVIALVRVGKWMEGRARREAGSAIRTLDHLRPEHARVRREGTEVEIATGDLRLGDLLVIKPGERIAADALIREGSGSADESLLTGESLPVAKAPGDTLVGGAVNGEALLVAEVTALAGESQLARMVRLVEDAQAAKPPVQRLVDRVSAVFVPVVIGLALATFAGWWLAGAGVEAAAVNAVAVLVIACPCALGLATPAAIMVGTGIAARYGILIRDPAAMEQARAIRTVVFDKTGTLTEGRPALVALQPAAGETREAVLRLAAALLAGSEHPLARAVLASAAGMVLPPAPTMKALAGRGVEGVVETHALRLGSARLMQEGGVDITSLDAAPFERDGRTVSYLAEGDKVLGLLAFGDALRAGAAQAVAMLKARGLHVVLLTGDNQGAADAAAKMLGIDDVRANALPADKAAAIAALRAKGPVAMVGDGVNDAPALAAADLGLALASGTDAAAAASGITLMRPDPRLAPAALDIAARTDRRIREGLVWAFGYNIIGIPLAAAGLLSPVFAGAAMALSSVSVVGSALLLRRWRPEALR